MFIRYCVFFPETFQYFTTSPSHLAAIAIIETVHSEPLHRWVSLPHAGDGLHAERKKNNEHSGEDYDIDICTVQFGKHYQ